MSESSAESDKGAQSSTDTVTCGPKFTAQEMSTIETTFVNTPFTVAGGCSYDGCEWLSPVERHAWHVSISEGEGVKFHEDCKRAAAKQLMDSKRATMVTMEDILKNTQKRLDADRPERERLKRIQSQASTSGTRGPSNGRETEGNGSED